MKQKKSIIIIICVSLVALLIIGIGSTLASAPAPEKNVFTQAISPNGGGGPGAVDNWFTYQGYLEDEGVPVNDVCDFEFSLWDSSGSGVPPTGGIQIGVTETLLSLPVTDGLFSYPLNWSSSFGDDAFNGQRRYLQIDVRCPVNSGAYTTLAPRQHLTAAPYALSLRPGAIISDTQNDTLLTVINTSDSGTLGSAIYARGKSDTAPAIAARHEGIGHALYGTSDSSYPTIGGLNAGIGTGVYGSSFSGTGVVGVQDGYSTSDNSAWRPGGLFGGANGVVGITKAYIGRAVYGQDKSIGGGWAGYFTSSNGNGVYISAPNVGLNVVSGSKNAVVRTEDGSRLMYSEEATEVWFTDYGFGQLDGGTAVILIDPIFAQTVNLNEPYHVFLQAYDDADLYVTNRTADGFEVQLREGSDSAEFSYRIVATRLGYEDTRLERAPWADNDPNLYPEKANETMNGQQGGQ